MSYVDFYSMTANPFIRGIPTEAIYKTEQVDNAINRLGYACRNKQFALIIGPQGAGKTTIIRCVLEKLDPSEYQAVYMSERNLEPRLFYNRILHALGHEGSHHCSTARMAVQREIEKLKGKKVIVVVDDAQKAPYDMLDEIKFALNYKMDTENPFAFIMSGTDTLLKTLKTPSYSATLNRVEMECRLSEMSQEETAAYIKHQTEYAGCDSKLFTEAAVSKIYRQSHGLPIMINKICGLSLELGAQCENSVIGPDIVETVMQNEMSYADTSTSRLGYIE